MKSISIGITSEESLLDLISEAKKAGLEIRFIDKPEPYNDSLVCVPYVEIYRNYRIDQAYRAIENKLHGMGVERGWFQEAKDVYENS